MTSSWRHCFCLTSCTVQACTRLSSLTAACWPEGHPGSLPPTADMATHALPAGGLACNGQHQLCPPSPPMQPCSGKQLLAACLKLVPAVRAATSRSHACYCHCQHATAGGLTRLHWLCCRNGEAPPGRGQADSDLLRGLHLLHRSVATYVASKMGPSIANMPEDMSPIAALAGEPCPGSVCHKRYPAACATPPQKSAPRELCVPGPIGLYKVCGGCPQVWLRVFCGAKAAASGQTCHQATCPCLPVCRTSRHSQAKGS